MMNMKPWARRVVLGALVITAAYPAWPVAMAYAFCPERPPYGCGCKGGPGYRAADGHLRRLQGTRQGLWKSTEPPRVRKRTRDGRKPRVCVGATPVFQEVTGLGREGKWQCLRPCGFVLAIGLCLMLETARIVVAASIPMGV